MSKRLRQSRWRRLPGVFRIGDRKAPDPNLEEQRLTLYLPGVILDRAEAMALRSGAESVQAYCTRLLLGALDDEHSRERVEEVEARRGPLEGLDQIASDPEYLAEWTASARPRGFSSGRAAVPPPTETGGGPDPDDADGPTDDEATPVVAPSGAVEVVLRHAGMVGDDPGAFLTALRRGEPVGDEASQELLQALRTLEVEFRSVPSLDRHLAYALHRLAFEGQVLLTDAWRGAAVEGATIDVLRIVQEAVDRVLSGEDIRYFAPDSGPGGGA